MFSGIINSWLLISKGQTLGDHFIGFLQPNQSVLWGDRPGTEFFESCQGKGESVELWKPGRGIRWIRVEEAWLV